MVRTLEDKLSASEASASMIRRIREACAVSCISHESTERIIANYQRTKFQPFMFDLRP